jgi:hypothetical protein
LRDLPGMTTLMGKEVYVIQAIVAIVIGMGLAMVIGPNPFRVRANPFRVRRRPTNKRRR